MFNYLYAIKRFGVAAIIMTVGTGCGGFVEPMTEADCFPDEIFDPVSETCLLVEEPFSEDVMTADDCFDDEYFDEADQMCYLNDEAAEVGDRGIAGWLGTVASDILDNGISFSDGENAEILVRYAVDGDTLGTPEVEIEDELANDSAAHLALWNEFAALIPATFRRDITYFGVFTDGMDGTLAFVEPNEAAPTTWIIVLDPADSVNKDDFIYTLIHEYGHVLTLNDRQVPFDETAYFDESGEAALDAEDACGTFFTGEGCAQSTSYISAFFDRFWHDIYDELPYPDEDGFVDEDELDDFYSRYADRFVTDYAATNPGEDITESWTHFVLNEKPAGTTVAEQKILFFYDYPELVELRQEILQALAGQAR